MTTTEKSAHARIKWLLIAASVLVAIGGLSLVWVPYHRQIRLVEDVEALPRLGYSAFWGSLSIDPPRISMELVGPDWLRSLVSDERMIGFARIKHVVLADAPIDDAWLKRLGHLSSLEYLDLHDTHISDNGLMHLAGLSNLSGLSLDGTQISDDGLKHLTVLSSLTELHLDNTQISDDGLKDLAGLLKLGILSLEGTQISDEGVKKLKQALPDCYINR